MKRAARPAFLLALGLAALAPAATQAPTSGLRYTTSSLPPRPAPGEVLVFELGVEGLSASSARVEELSLDSGLSLESESLRPVVLAAARGTAFRFELRVLAAGTRRIDSLAVAGAEGRLKLGPIIVCEARAPSSEGPDRAAAAWRWLAPARALRYEAFEARLEPAPPVTVTGGATSTPVTVTGEATASFAAPAGVSFEPSGRLSWTVIAFEEGSLILPEAIVLGGSGSTRASASSVEILPLPTRIFASRAIGKFRLSIKGPETAPSSAAPGSAPSVVAGSPLRLRLVLEGRGNLPALILPEPAISLGGRALSREDWTSSRADESRAEAGSYVGSASLLIDLLPSEAGLLSLRFPALPVYDPASGEARLELAPLELHVSEAAISGRAALQAARGAADGPSLAALYAALRRAPPFSREARELAAAARARAAELGAAPPLLDPLPPPSYFAAPAFLVALAGLSLFIASRARGNEARGRSRGRAGKQGLASLLLALALTCGVLGLAAAAGRRENYAVVWAERLMAVPSASSGLGASIVRGSTARVRGTAAEGGYASVRLADGTEGWVPRSSLYFY